MARLLLAFLLACGTTAWAENSPNPDALQRLVHQDCGSCHGLTLKGGLGPDIRPQSLSHYDAEILAEVILEGIPGTAMPPWRPLITTAEADWIANYLLQSESQ